jgi:hypothetical protein
MHRAQMGRQQQHGPSGRQQTELARIFGQNLRQQGLIQLLGLEWSARRRHIDQVLDAMPLPITLHPTMDRAAVHPNSICCLRDRRAFSHTQHRLETPKQAGGSSLPHGQP